MIISFAKADVKKKAKHMGFAFFAFHFVIDRMRKQLLMSILDVIHIFFVLFPLHTVLLKISQCQILKYLVQAIIDAVHNIFLDRLCHNGSSSFPIAGLRLQMVRTFQSFHDLGNRNLVCRIIQQIPTLRAFDASDDPGPAKACKYLFQVLRGYLVALRNASQ